MPGIKRIVLDVLKPINMPTAMLSLKLSKVRGVEGVDVLIQDVEQKVESAKVTIEGENMDFENVKTAIEKLGASVQSVDRITSGKRIVG
ncbi:DUF211 domain-containing protein [Candidatus Micrarchaeota archaeon]|nr:DUF211 domain-containing protein [Candidatus Micrarchaeota archaeon]